MKLLRILKINIKNIMISSPRLCILFMLSISVCLLVLIIYNDIFWTEQESYISSQVQNHSISISFNSGTNFETFEKIANDIKQYSVDYIILSSDINENINVKSLGTFIPKNKNPYDYMYSAINKERMHTEPVYGDAYISVLLSISSQGKDILLNNTVNIGNNSFVISDICSLSIENIDLIIPYDIFLKANKINRIIIVVDSKTSESAYSKISENLCSKYNEIDIQINNTLSDRASDSYDETLKIMIILLCACIINYFGIFKYMYLKCMKDYNVMRLFGLNIIDLICLLFSEFLIYNFIATVFAIICFIFICISGDALIIDIGTRLYNSVPILLGFFFSNVILGIICVINFFRASPVKRYN